MLPYKHTPIDTRGRKTSSLGLTHGHSLRTMARILGQAPSTLSREVARNHGYGAVGVAA